MDPKKAARLYHIEKAEVEAIRAGRRLGRQARDHWRYVSSVAGVKDALRGTGTTETTVQKRVTRDLPKRGTFSKELPSQATPEPTTAAGISGRTLLIGASVLALGAGAYLMVKK